MAARGRPPRGAAAQAAAAARAAAAGVAGVPAPPVVPAVPAPARLPPLTAIERAFVRIGFTENGARALCSVDGENVSLDALPFLDDKVVKTMCQTMRKPGGGDVGVAVPTRAEMALYVTCYMARHYQRTSRTMTEASITMAMVDTFSKRRTNEEGYKEPSDKLKLPGPDKILDFIDEWPEHLALYNGQNGGPLSYIIRNVTDPPDEDTDIAFGMVGSRFGSPRDEIEERAPHGTPEYQVDNARVFEMLNDAIGNHKNVKTWIKAYARMKDGRGAWEAFKEHFRGTNQMDAIEASAEKQLATLVYRGEKPRYNFESHVSKHLRAHLDIAKAGGVLNERQKVRKLVESLQASSLVAAIAQVRANDKFLDSFDQTVSYLRTFIIATDQVETRNVASVEGEGKGKKRVRFVKNGQKNDKKNKKGKFTNGKGKDRFYKPEEWYALSEDKRKEIIKLRKENKAQTSSVNTESENEDTTQVSSTQTSQRSR
jgi:hypothetical protein